ncbi:MAG: SirB2 family protein [Gammaproteobacteria bacterium]|nr:SirB2 family protein [Gammaproteobacteria bacterium]MBU6509629.1 SirB2 family protein [Gammaproteobacteria bacterium]MDE1983715.1 SirB2 family protein [Gammaproteobacteria bacterium]MDE2109086.1 SirB2 family protein [Gammaproteobacteria bacterium]MDE2461100.1 SirB2 family protein [Gammaproteobacteria bacterium]
MFLEVRLAHIIFAAGSIGLFVLRGAFTVLAARPLKQRIWKILPHIVDTLLLAMGVWLAVMLRLNPFHVTWLGVKILCVIGYIVLGVLAFRLQRPRWLRFSVFAAAILLFAFIVSIALFQDPRGIFVLVA